MILSDTAIKRPVFTTMVIGAIVVFGVISFGRIGVDLFPRVEFPIITIVSVLPGADPSTVEVTVTDPIEEAVATISGIKHLRSTSSSSVSQVVVEFKLDKDVDVAYQEITAKLGGVRSQLPADLEDPIVEKFDIDAAPIMAVIVGGDLPRRELTRIADDIVKESLQRIENVGQVRRVGGAQRKIWLWLDRAKLEGHDLTVQEVQAAVRRQHIELPGGRVMAGPQELLTKIKAEFDSARGFEQMVVAQRGDATIRLRDVGYVQDGLEETRSFARLDDQPAVALLVRRQSGTNTVAVADAVEMRVAELRKELAPRGVSLRLAQEQAPFVRRSVEEVQFHLAFGGGLAVFIVLVFLRNLRSTFISSLVLPTSILGTVVMMNVLGFSQNMMTLLGLSLAIGLLIDDAIVVQENIMRHVEKGTPARQAASFATNEIALAVLATTLSVVAVFVPVAFMQGLVGRFFFQFGVTVACAVLISLFVSFTLDPMLSSRILRKPTPGRIHRGVERMFAVLDRAYGWLLRRALRHRAVVVAIALAAFLSSAYAAKFLRAEFLPQEDQAEFNIKVRAPLGATLAATDAIAERIRKRLVGQAWLDYTFVTIGADELQRVNEGTLYVKLTPKGSRATSQQQAMQWVRERVAGIGDATVSVEVVPRVAGGGWRWAEVQLEVRGTKLKRLENITKRITARMKATTGYVDVTTTYEQGKPELSVVVDRAQASDLGVSPAAIAATINALIGGLDVSKFRVEGDRFDVGLRLQRRFRDSPTDLARLSVRGRSGQLVRLQSVVKVRDTEGPVQINRYNRARQITILSNLQHDKKVLGEAVAELTTFADEAGVPPGYTIGFAGNAEMMTESFQALLFALGLAILMVYMVLAAQFESFIHPFTIMLSVPLAVIGALGALVLLDMTMSIFTMIGIIMLMGLVTKNGILLVDYTNILRARDGLGKRDALLRAGAVRLRPILMTTLAMIFGMLPIALGTGAGSESRAPMAVAVIGGLVTSTLLTLVVVPVVYTILDDLRHPSGWRLVKFLRSRSASDGQANTASR